MRGVLCALLGCLSAAGAVVPQGWGPLQSEQDAQLVAEQATRATLAAAIAKKVATEKAAAAAEAAKAAELMIAAADGVTTEALAAANPMSTTLHAEPAGCHQPDPRGYLFPLLSNQFNNQLVGLGENIRLAQRLGRILVLPGFVEVIENRSSTSKTSDGKDFFDSSVRHRLRPFSDIISLQSLLPLVECIDLQTFKSICVRSRPAEAHAFVPEWEPRIQRGSVAVSWQGSGRRWQVPERLYQCDPKNWPAPCDIDGFKTEQNYRADPLPELRGLDFSEVQLFAHDASTKVPLASFPAGTDVPTLITDGLLFKTNATLPPLARNVEAIFATLGSLRWSKPLRAAVKHYIETHFGREPFVAIHWRRGYLGKVLPEARSVEQVADALADAMSSMRRTRGHDTKVNIYIASNQLNEADVARVSELLNASSTAKLHSLLLEPALTAGLGIDELSRIEQGICGEADAFIDTPKSTWSAVVDAFRGKYGQREEKRYEGMVAT